jgi:hypothetical protein
MGSRTGSGSRSTVEREWFVVRLRSKRLPQVALAFEKFLCEEGQAQTLMHLDELRVEQPLRREPRLHRNGSSAAA